MAISERESALRELGYETARARVERMNDAWAKLLDTPEESTAAELHRELHTLKGESRLLGMSELHRLCAKLEELVFLAHRRHYEVPAEMFLTVSMGMEFLGFLIASSSSDGASLDLAGFIDQLDEVLRDAGASPPKADDSRRSLSAGKKSGKYPAEGAQPDRLNRATRERLARVAMDIHLEALRTEGGSALRLRESWMSLRRELTALGRTSVRPRLVRQVDGAMKIAIDLQKVVNIAAEIDDVVVSPEVAAVLETAAVHLLNNAIAHGVEAPDRRAAAGKPREGKILLSARHAAGAAVLSVEDDGAGIDLAAVTAAAIAQNLLPAGTPPEARSAHSIIFERGLTTCPEPGTAALAGRGVGLDAVRDAVEKEGGTVVVRSVEGRGTSMTVTLPDTATNIDVRTFRSDNGKVLLAVDTSWQVSDGTAERLDPLGALGLSSNEEVAFVQTVVFRKGARAYEVSVRSAPMLRAAERICPTRADELAEVVVVGGTEAILLRLDNLADRASHSTAPPPPDSSASVMESRAASLAPLPSTPHKVLLIDDSVPWLVSMRSALLHRGFDVRAVSAISDFADALLHWSPDVVLADVNMPEVSGDELCRRVKVVRPLVPVILCSDMDPRALEDLAVSVDADGAVAKSLGPNELARTIHLRCDGVSPLR